MITSFFFPPDSFTVLFGKDTAKGLLTANNEISLFNNPKCVIFPLDAKGPSWDNKTEQAFFRGRDSREERLQLVRMSTKYPDLLDAGITGYFFFREMEKQLGKAPLVGFFDFFKVSPMADCH